MSLGYPEEMDEVWIGANCLAGSIDGSYLCFAKRDVTLCDMLTVHVFQSTLINDSRFEKFILFWLKL